MTPQPIPEPGDLITNYRLGVTGIVDEVGKGRNTKTVYIKLEDPGNPAPVPSDSSRKAVKSYDGQIRPEALPDPSPSLTPLLDPNMTPP